MKKNLHALAGAEHHAHRAHGCDRDARDIERRVRAATLALLMGPPERNAYLRRCYAEALGAAKLTGDPHECDLHVDILEPPGEVERLEALEQLLLDEYDERSRARRLRTYMEQLEREHDRFTT